MQALSSALRLVAFRPLPALEFCVRPMGQPTASEPPHIPVLLDEVLEALAPIDGARIVDGTFGAGGYSRALLNAGATVVALDRDPSVKPFVDALAAEFPSRFSFIAG